MPKFKNYREMSKETNWGTFNEGLSIEQVNCGSLLRIADATEAMSTNFTSLYKELQQMTEERTRYRNLYYIGQKQLAAYKGQITKLKKKINGTKQ
jgi:hypothetical protein